MSQQKGRIRRKKRQRPRRLARLGRFMRSNGIRPLQLADATGISRQHLYRLRYGQQEPTRDMMIRIAVGCRHILGRKRVRIYELFDI